MFGREQQFGMILEVDAAGLSDLAVAPASSCLQETATAVAIPVTRIDIAEFLGLAGITETIDTFGNCGRLVRQLIGLFHRDGGRMPAHCEDFHEPSSAV